MKNRKNSYSIRKLSVGASSIIVASMLFIGGAARGRTGCTREF